MGRGERALWTFPCPVTIIFQLACATASGFAVLGGGSRLHRLCGPLPGHHATYVIERATATAFFFTGSAHSKDQGIPKQPDA